MGTWDYLNRRELLFFTEISFVADLMSLPAIASPLHIHASHLFHPSKQTSHSLVGLNQLLYVGVL